MKTESIYTVEYFIKKFQGIPDDRMCKGLIEDLGNGIVKFCAIGWCRTWHKETSSMPDTRESQALGFIIGSFLGAKEDDYQYYVTRVNDGSWPTYNQPTPKERVLSCLYDIYERAYGRKYVEQEQPKENITVIYKTIVIDKAVKELQETLTEN